MKTPPVETTQLVQPTITIPNTFAEVLRSSSGSAAGYSAVSNWLGCPERSRLNAKGVTKRYEWSGDGEALSDLAFGTLAHFLRSLRVLYGHDAVEHALGLWKGELPHESWLKAQLMFRVYESMYPRAQDSFKYLGTEVEVVTDVSRELPNVGLDKPIFRTVRYDSIVVLPGAGGSPDELFSFEAKTMARSGRGSLAPYTAQALCQFAIWNANPHLVKTYGRMSGVIWDCLVKTASPNVERIGPDYFGRVHQKLAVRYLAAADDGSVVFRADEHGHYPRMLHACWGRWRACDYTALCHEGAVGEYTLKDGTPYEGD